MTLGERIKQRRMSLGISQIDLAVKVGTTKQQIYKYENGIISNIPSDKVEEIAKALGTTPGYLMGWEEKNAPTVSDERTKRFIDLFSQLSPEQQDLVISQLEGILSKK